MNFNTDSEQFGRDFAKGFTEQMGDNFDFSSFAKGFEKNSRSFGYSAGNFFKGMADAANEANDQFGASFGQVYLRRYLPLMIATGLATTALPLAYNYIYKVMVRNIGKPKMALKQRRTNWFSSIKNAVWSTKQAPAPKPIFKSEIEGRVKDLVESTNNLKKNNSYFQNVVLYGPGGTGKTMVAEMIATNSDMDYIMMSGGELGQFVKRGDHVTEFNTLWESALKSSKPTIIFIDEAEGLCKKRDDLGQEHLELQNSFLNKTGTPSKQIMIILATNRIDDLDPAIINRMTHKIPVESPGFIERIKIIDMYIKQFFEDLNERQAVFTPQMIEDIANKTDKFTGRTLFQMINAIFAKKGTTAENRVTKQMVENILNNFVEQEKKFQS